jgi:hypothetical protein
MTQRDSSNLWCWLLAIFLVGWVFTGVVAAQPADWKEFMPKEGGFSIKFPAATKSGKAGTGSDPFNTERAVVNQVNYTLYWRLREKPFENAKAADAYMKGQQQGVAKSGTLVNEAEIAVDGVKGREFTVNIKDRTLRCRVFVIDRVLVTLVIQGPTAESVQACANLLQIIQTHAREREMRRFVSCSPYRVPIARVAAAQAALGK